MAKVKATTILETVIAMVIILLVFVISTTVILNISKSGLTEKKIKANEEINIYVGQLKIEEPPFEIEEKINDFLLRIKVDRYLSNNAIVLVQCQALDVENKVIAEQKRLMLKNNQ